MIQLGTRWSVGDDAPDRLPSAVADAVQDVEAELAEQGVDTESWNWTLTWLEGKPVCELDDGTVIEYSPDTDEATIVPYEE